MPKSELIELTEAHKNGFVTKDEYKELFGNELIFSALRIANKKDVWSIMLSSSILHAELVQVHVIISRPILKKPHPEFKKGGILTVANNDEAEIIITKDKAAMLPNINIK